MHMLVTEQNVHQGQNKPRPIKLQATTQEPAASASLNTLGKHEGGSIPYVSVVSVFGRKILCGDGWWMQWCTMTSQVAWFVGSWLFRHIVQRHPPKGPSQIINSAPPCLACLLNRSCMMLPTPPPQPHIPLPRDLQASSMALSCKDSAHLLKLLTPTPLPSPQCPNSPSTSTPPTPVSWQASQPQHRLWVQLCYPT